MIAETTQWIMALNHPLRRQILRAVSETGSLDTATLSQRLDLPLGSVSYHLKVLADLELLKPERPLRIAGDPD